MVKHPVEWALHCIFLVSSSKVTGAFELLVSTTTTPALQNRLMSAAGVKSTHSSFSSGIQTFKLMASGRAAAGNNVFKLKEGSFFGSKQGMSH